MSEFILVHGAWHGGWCWRRVAPLLRAAGHEAYAPSLTGAADRKHLLSRAIDLDTYRRDIVNLIEYEGLSDIILVGHSAAGAVISLASQDVDSRVGQLVYLDAAIVTDGQSLFDTFPPAWRDGMRSNAVDGWRTPPIPGMIQAFFAPDCTEEDRRWIADKVTDQPVGPYEQSVDLGRFATMATPKTFIRCTKTMADTTRERIEEMGWSWREIDAGHDAMISQPRVLANLLITIAQGG